MGSENTKYSNQLVPPVPSMDNFPVQSNPKFQGSTGAPGLNYERYRRDSLSSSSLSDNGIMIPKRKNNCKECYKVPLHVVTTAPLQNKIIEKPCKTCRQKNDQNSPLPVTIIPFNYDNNSYNPQQQIQVYTPNPSNPSNLKYSWNNLTNGQVNPKTTVVPLSQQEIEDYKRKGFVFPPFKPHDPSDKQTPLIPFEPRTEPIYIQNPEIKYPNYNNNNNENRVIYLPPQPPVLQPAPGLVSVESNQNTGQCDSCHKVTLSEMTNLQKLFDQYSNYDKRMSFQQFTDLYRQPYETAQHAFSLMDRDNDGYINFDDFLLGYVLTRPKSSYNTEQPNNNFYIQPQPQVSYLVYEHQNQPNNYSDYSPQPQVQVPYPNNPSYYPQYSYQYSSQQAPISTPAPLQTPVSAMSQIPAPVVESYPNKYKQIVPYRPLRMPPRPRRYIPGPRDRLSLKLNSNYDNFDLPIEDLAETLRPYSFDHYRY